MRTKDNYTMMVDFYEITMANGYFIAGLKDRICYFDVFFRTIPDKGGFAICAGLEQVVEYVLNLKFTEEDLAYLRRQNCFSEEFLDYLRDFKFHGDIYAVPEGTPVFPNEPILTVKATTIEAQLMETFLLAELNHQTLIATKASRIVRAACGRSVTEFGARRAHGAEAAILGARAAYIAGCSGTSCVASSLYFSVPSGGTMAHSWVQIFPNELTAFKEYCRIYPDNALLLVDTYDVVKSGVPNAIIAFNEVLAPLGKRPKGIRLDSGDIAYLSKKCRKMLDDAGYSDCKIFATNSLDEYLIRDLIFQGAKIDSFGVGERLITSKSDPVFDGVYKLCAIEDEEGRIIPKIKISENVYKITTPHFKKIYRFYSKSNHKAEADLLAIHDEELDFTKPFELFDPLDTWKRKTLADYETRELLVPVFNAGKLVYDLPDIEKIRNYCRAEVESLWDEVKRFENPHNYYVDLTEKLWNCKRELLLNRRSIKNKKKGHA